jgi:ketosteroid isomerase-like protein
MDDVYAINVAKTEIREAYNTGDVKRLLAILDDGLIDYPEGRCSGYGEGAKRGISAHFNDLFKQYEARLVPIIIEIKVIGDIALDYGWHELTLMPKSGGEVIKTKKRYVEIWKRDEAGDWKLAMFIDNTDVREEVSCAPAA